MKAKAIAEITANIADLKKQVSALSESLVDEHGAAIAASMIAQAIIRFNMEIVSAKLSATMSYNSNQENYQSTQARSLRMDGIQWS